MKIFNTVVVACFTIMASSISIAQNEGMMHDETWGGMWGRGWMGGYGGFWLPILLIAVVGLLFWLIVQKRK